METVNIKIKKGYYPPKLIKDKDGNGINPIFDHARYIVLPAFDNNRTIEIKTETVFDKKTYTGHKELEKDFLSGYVHPNDLKTAVAIAIK